MSFAEVVFNLPLDHAYTYKIPAEITNLQIGMRVLVPFGRRTITGVVVALPEKTNIKSLKSVIDVLDEAPLISDKMMELTRWIADYYISSWGQAIYLALPKGIDQKKEENIFISEQGDASNLTERQRELYVLIGGDPGKSKNFYRKKFGYSTFYYLLSHLRKKGLIYGKEALNTGSARKLIRTFVTIAGDYQQRKNAHADYLKYIKKRPEVDAFMAEHCGQSLLRSEFLKRTGMASGTLQKMAGYQLCTLEEKEVQRKPQWEFSEEKREFQLTAEQVQVIGEIKSGLKEHRFAPFLLHGVTGSGKTQVYIEILKAVLDSGQDGIILIPEIALTPQTMSRFQSLAPDKVAVFHSKMTPGERLDAWMACYQGRTRVVIGPRSALFAPLKNIGLIVVDEEHETTYKQYDTIPRYHARDVALYWARLHQATVILGSATPSLESFYNARIKKYQLLEIRNRVDNLRMPAVYIVDMRQKRVRMGPQVSLFSQVLLDKIGERLKQKKQIILLQNRRGYSSFMQCTSCGFIAVCPNCDVTLTYHSYNEKLQCHICGYSHPAYHDCPNCGGKQIVYKGVGTQRVQNELQQLLPAARIMRMDQDTTRGKKSHDQMLSSFSRGEADILLGTQMIAKGLDFGNVTLVGVISADVGLAIPDFRAPERVFQLLTQVAGRTGRRDNAGEVVIQSKATATVIMPSRWRTIMTFWDFTCRRWSTAVIINIRPISV